MRNMGWTNEGIKSTNVFRAFVSDREKISTQVLCKYNNCYICASF